MQVYSQKFNSGLPNQTFKAACNIKNVYINGKLYGQTQYEVIQRVAKVLSSSMYKNALSDELMEKVYKFFPDFRTEHSSAVASSNIRKYKVNILTGNDAQVYRNNFLTSEPKSEQQEKGRWLLERMLRLSGNKRLTIYAEENAGNLVITDIIKAVKGRQ